MRTSQKGLAVSVPGIGHSDICGLVTAGQWSAANSYSLTSWITVSCAIRVCAVDNSDLEKFQASSRCSQCLSTVVRWHFSSYNCVVTGYGISLSMSRTCRRRRCSASFTLIVKCHSYAMLSVIMPQIKHASSRAIAVFATLCFLPLFKVIRTYLLRRRSLALSA